MVERFTPVNLEALPPAVRGRVLQRLMQAGETYHRQVEQKPERARRRYEKALQDARKIVERYERYER